MIVACFIGLFVALAVIGAIKMRLAGAPKIETEISRIEKRVERSLGESKVSYSVFVRYSFNGKEYEAPLNYYHAAMRVGDKIAAYVDPDNPKRLSAEGGLWLNLFFCAMPVFAFYIGFITLKMGLRAQIRANPTDPPQSP